MTRGHGQQGEDWLWGGRAGESNGENWDNWNRTTILKNTFYLVYILKGRRRKGERERKRNIDVRKKTSISCFSHMPQSGTKPATQAYALNCNQTCDLLLCGMKLNQLSHTGQGSTNIFLNIYSCTNLFLLSFRKCNYCWPSNKFDPQAVWPSHRFELCGCSYMWIFSINTANVFSLSYDFLNNIFFSLAYFIVRIQHIMHTTYKICANWLFMLLVRLPVSSWLFVVKSQKLYTDFQLLGVNIPNPCIVQESTAQKYLVFWYCPTGPWDCSFCWIFFLCILDCTISTDWFLNLLIFPPLSSPFCYCTHLTNFFRHFSFWF